MAKTKISEFSATPGNNTDIDGINIAEGCAPSGINDAIRELMSQLKDFQAGTAGDSFNGPVGTTTAAAGAFTTLSASSTATLNTLASSGATLTGGSINNMAIGGTTAAAASVTTLTTSSTVTHNGGTANGVAYLNGSKVLTTGIALTFDGAKLGVGTTPSATIHGYVADGGYVLGLSGTTKGLRVSTDSSQTLIQGVDNTLIGSYQPLTFGGSILVFQVNGTTEQMRLTSTGLGIGTSSPGEKLQVAGAIRATGAVSANAPGGILAYQGSSVTMLGAWGANASTVGQIQFYLSSSDGSINGELMRLTSTGLGIGTSSPGEKLQVGSGSASSNSVLLLNGASTSAYGAGIKLQKNSVNVGFIGSASWMEGGTSDDLAFSANSGATIGMRLNSSGNLGLGVTPSAWSGLGGIGVLDSYSWAIATQGAADISTFVTNAYFNGTNWIYKRTATAASYQQRTGAHKWSTAPSGTAGTAISFTQAMTLDASGNLLVGTTGGVTGGGFSIQPVSGQSTLAIGHITGTGSGQPFAQFYYAGTQIGSITQSGTTAVLYNVTSDQRLKENIVDAPEFGGVIDSIKVRSYDWKADGNHQRAGFIAQELVTVAPEAVHQPEDPEEMMAVDYSKLVPMLVKEVQSLRARVAQLESN
jgi:hypothetical protein